jgi:hypothetical protein
MAPADLSSLDEDAADYVTTHRLEEHLSAAVDLAIHERAENPLQLIIDHLQRVLASGAGAPTAPTPKRTHNGLGSGRL